MIYKSKVVVVLAALASACGGANAGGQSGDLSGNSDDDSETANGSHCTDTPQDIALDQVTELGFSASDVLSFAARRFESSLVWHPSPIVTYGPESGQGRIVLEISHTGASAQFIRSEPKASSGGAEIAIGVNCPERVRIPVTVSLHTAGGALAESISATIEAKTRYGAALAAALDHTALNGTFTVQSVKDNGTVKQFGVSAELTPFGMSGEIASGVETGSRSNGPDSAVGFTRVRYASWPDDVACAASAGEAQGLPITAEQMLLGFSGTTALETFNAQNPIALTWQDGKSTSLNLTASGLSSGCVRLPNVFGFDGNASFVATYPVTLTAKTDDGRIDGSYGAKLTVLAASDGSAGEISANALLNLPPAELAKTGFKDITLSDTYDELITNISARVGGAKAGGELLLQGLKRAPCATEPPPPDPQGGSGTPGCRGADFITLQAGSWTSQ